MQNSKRACELNQQAFEFCIHAILNLLYGERFDL